MLNTIVESSLRRRLFVLILFSVAAVAGGVLLTQIPVDAVPDITPVQVVVNTKTGGLDPEQIEKTVSTPIETEMGGIGRVQEVRSLSKNGLSQVVVVFEDKTDIYWARQQVSERLQSVRETLPEGLSPELAPITTGLGEVLMYVVLPKPGSALAAKGEIDRLLYLRTVQDFVIRRYLKSNVQNVAEVDANGGFKKEIHVDVDPVRLEQMGLSIEEVVKKLESVGESFGGGYIQHEGRQIIVRTEGASISLDRIRRMAVKLDLRGTPVPLSAVAEVREDYTQRQGAATYNGEEAVLGTVLMRSGANSRQVAQSAERALTETPLPDDVEVKIVYSRQYFVDATIRTVATNLAEGAALVVVILLLILGNVRAAMIVSLAIPLSMLYAAAGMKYFGISANLMSLGAIDFGLLVDASVVIVENVFRRLGDKSAESGMTAQERLAVVLDSVKEVIVPVTVGRLLIMAVYVPILSLDGIEGKLFEPMAQTVLMALATSLVVGVALMPVLSYLILRPTRGEQRETFFFKLLQRMYGPVLTFSLNHRAVILIPVIAAGGLSLYLFFGLGADFMPPMNEGDLVVNLVRDSSIALDESVRVQKTSDRVIKSFDEVDRVFSRIGTPESATDPMGVHLSDVFVILKKDSKARPVQPNGRRRTKDELFEAIREAIDRAAAGQEIMASQPIEMRFGEILEGTRSDVSLRIYGPDLEKLMEMTEKSRETIEKIPGASEVELDALSALRKSPVLSVRMDDWRLAQHGIDLDEVNTLLESAMSGREVGSFYEHQWRFPVIVRLDEKYRENPKDVARLPVGLPDGGVVPLSALADIEERELVTTISHNRSERYAAVAINLSADRDIQSFVREAKETLSKNLDIPKGYRLSWGGQFKNLERAVARLRIIVPLTLLVIFLVLLQNFGKFRQAVLIYLSIPFAMTGGVLSLYLRDIPFSVSASVGFIALTGIAILNAMVLVTFFNQLRRSGAAIEDAVTRGAMTRLRPVMMTAAVAALGFVPMALNTGIGAEVQRPLATVVIGGIVSSTVLTLLVLPTLYLWLESKE